MRQREFISLVGSTAVAWLARGARSNPQQKFLCRRALARRAEEGDVDLSVLRKAFNDLGYIEGIKVS